MTFYTIRQVDLNNFESKNCVLSINNVPAIVGSTIAIGDVLKLVPNSGYKINSASFNKPGRLSPATPYPFTVENKHLATLTTTSAMSGGSSTGYNFTIDSAVDAPTLLLNISQNNLDVFSTNKCKLLINDVEAILNSPVYVGDILKAIPLTGFAISSICLVKPGSLGQVFRYWFIVSDPPLEANLETSDAMAGGTSAYNFEVTSIPYAPEVEGNNRVYLINSTILKEVNNQRFQSSSGGTIDYGEYILGLISLPFPIPENSIGEDGFIQLGDLTLTTESPTVKTDKLSLDLGSIETPKINNNSLDYLNTICNLHLPFANSIEIDSNYVIGETIGIEYIVDLYSGKTTINISSSKLDGEIFKTTTVDLGVSIPYISTRNNANLDNPNISIGGNNRIRTPFIEVIRSNSVLPSGFFTAPIEDEGTLDNYIGYLEGIEVELLTAASLSEKLDIVSKLKGGVIIK